MFKTREDFQDIEGEFYLFENNKLKKSSLCILENPALWKIFWLI